MSSFRGPDQLAESATCLVADASVLINLIHSARLDLLAAVVDSAVLVPREVVAEITRPEQATALEEAIRAGILRPISITAIEEIEIYAELETVMGKGEAACLAAASGRGCLVACDERGRLARAAQEVLGEGRVINTPGLFVLAIHHGELSIAQADAIKAHQEESRFTMRFESFADVVDGSAAP